MPELEPKNLSSIKKLKEHLKITRSGWPSDSELRVLIKNYDEEYVGHGTEVIVVRHRDNDNFESGKLIAFNYKDINAERAKEIFYLHRFFSTLFPYNFPHFYASTGADPNPQKKSVSGTIRQEIKKIQLSPLQEEFSLVRYPFRNVVEICSQLGIELNCDDIGERNFIFGAGSGEYYVDTLKRTNVAKWDVDKIFQYMKTNNYNLEDIKIIKMCIERLKVLNKQKES